MHLGKVVAQTIAPCTHAHTMYVYAAEANDVLELSLFAFLLPQKRGRRRVLGSVQQVLRTSSACVNAATAK